MHVLPHLNEAQHGFLHRKSTVTYLLEYVSFIVEALDHREQINALMLDFTKTFDHILLVKLQSFDFAATMLSWFTSYLSERHNFVVFKAA